MWINWKQSRGKQQQWIRFGKQDLQIKTEETEFVYLDKWEISEGAGCFLEFCRHYMRKYPQNFCAGHWCVVSQLQGYKSYLLNPSLYISYVWGSPQKSHLDTQCMRVKVPKYFFILLLAGWNAVIYWFLLCGGINLNSQITSRAVLNFLLQITIFQKDWGGWGKQRRYKLVILFSFSGLCLSFVGKEMPLR